MLAELCDSALNFLSQNINDSNNGENSCIVVFIYCRKKREILKQDLGAWLVYR